LDGVVAHRLFDAEGMASFELYGLFDIILHFVVLIAFSHIADFGCEFGCFSPIWPVTRLSSQDEAVDPI